MTAAIDITTRLAYDDTGAGVPVVFLHGLTFDRRTWRPIVARLGESVRSIAVDLPAHGESGGAPAPVEAVADQLHELLASLEVERPIVVGHSMSAGIAVLYAVEYPTAGVVLVDNGPEVAAFAEVLHRLEPMLRGPGFAEAWQPFEASLGIDRIAEPERSLVLDAHVVRQEVVVGYWEQLLQSDPAELQAWVDGKIPRLNVPCLGVFGRTLTDGERARLGRLADVEIEEWVEDGHCVHLVEVDRFAARLARFVARCTG